MSQVVTDRERARTEVACDPQDKEKKKIKNRVIRKTFMIDLPVILFTRAIWEWEKKKNNKLNSISPANDTSAQMTFSWGSPSHLPATIKNKKNRQ